MNFLVDTISFRIKFLEYGFKSIVDFLGLSKVIKKQIGETSGIYNNNYLESYRMGGIILAWNGQQGFDGYVYMSGQGCRLYESLYKEAHGYDLDWFEFIKLLDIMQSADLIHMTRLDIACDDFTDRLRINRLHRYVRQNRFKSRVKFFLGKCFANDELQIGSPKSSQFLRIYNKKLERGYLPEDNDGLPWYRAEFQLRDNSASQFVSAWVKNGDIGFTFMCYLNGYIVFTKEPNNHDGNQSKLKTAPWWKSFIGDVEKLRFVKSVGTEYNLSRVERYAIHTAGSSVRTLIEAREYSPEDVWRLFTACELRDDQRILIREQQKTNEERRRFFEAIKERENSVRI